MTERDVWKWYYLPDEPYSGMVRFESGNPLTSAEYRCKSATQAKWLADALNERVEPPNRSTE